MSKTLRVDRKSIRQNQTFTSEEWETLHLVHDTALKLRSKKFLSEGAKVSFEVRFDHATGMHPIVNSAPDEETLESVLPTLRKFCAEKELTFLPRVLNILYQKVPDQSFREFVNFIRKRYNQATNLQKYPEFIIQVGEKNYGPGEFFNLWINGEVFHSDSEKRQEISKLKEVLGGIVYGFFVDAVIEISNVILTMLNLLSCQVEPRFRCCSFKRLRVERERLTRCLMTRAVAC